MAVHLLDESVGKNEPRHNEEDRNHRRARIDEPNNGQLPQGRLFTVLIARVGSVVRHTCPVVDEDDEGCETSDSIEVSSRMRLYACRLGKLFCSGVELSRTSFEEAWDGEEQQLV